MTTKQAVSTLTKALQNDDTYFAVWKANIARKFVRECHARGYDFPELHSIANDAASQFLILLCNESKKDV